MAVVRFSSHEIDAICCRPADIIPPRSQVCVRFDPGALVKLYTACPGNIIVPAPTAAVFVAIEGAMVSPLGKLGGKVAAGVGGIIMIPQLSSLHC